MALNHSLRREHFKDQRLWNLANHLSGGNKYVTRTLLLSNSNQMGDPVKTQRQREWRERQARGRIGGDSQ